MDHRPLGRTGVSVTKLCLGTMMFGAWGNPDHDDSIRIIHAALDAGINFVDTADVYSRGESEANAAAPWHPVPALHDATGAPQPRGGRPLAHRGHWAPAVTFSSWRATTPGRPGRAVSSSPGLEIF
jgi:hypothetical protein